VELLPRTEFQTFLRGQLADCETQWSVGAFGALAEFSRDPHEPVEFVYSDRDLSAITARGGIRITPLAEMRPVASESITRESWNHRIALCLRESHSAMAQRPVLTELGPDREALRERDRDAVLFDLGLGAQQVDACIRVSDRSVISGLRALTGRNVFEPGNPVMTIVLPHSPNRVFVSRVGRLEVFQPIPPPDGRSPEGPHTHVLPKLLQHRRTHASTEQIPEGFVPCAHLFPAHPAKDAFGRAIPFNEERYAFFQKALQQFGDKDIVDLKRRVCRAIEDGAGPATVAVPNDRFARGSVRVALRQLKASRRLTPVLAAWLQVYDASGPNGTEIDEIEAAHVQA
jgi:hypothetical protein